MSFRLNKKEPPPKIQERGPKNEPVTKGEDESKKKVRGDRGDSSKRGTSTTNPNFWRQKKIEFSPHEHSIVFREKGGDLKERICLRGRSEGRGN